MFYILNTENLNIIDIHYYDTRIEECRNKYDLSIKADLNSNQFIDLYIFIVQLILTFNFKIHK